MRVRNYSEISLRCRFTSAKHHTHTHHSSHTHTHTHTHHTHTHTHTPLISHTHTHTHTHITHHTHTHTHTHTTHHTHTHHSSHTHTHTPLISHTHTTHHTHTHTHAHTHHSSHTHTHTLSQMEVLGGLKHCLVDVRPSSFDDCIKWARELFQEHFYDTLAQLLYNFPPDHVRPCLSHELFISFQLLFLSHELFISRHLLFNRRRPQASHSGQGQRGVQRL